MKRKIIFLSLSTLLFAVIVLLLNVDTLIKDRLNQYIVQDENSTYNYHVGELEIGFIAQQLKLSNIEIRPNDTSIDSAKTRKSLYLIHIEEFTLEGFDFIELLLFNKIDIELIDIQKPEFSLYKFKNAHSDSLSDNKELVSDILSKSIGQMNINLLSISNAKSRIYKVDTDTTSFLIANKLDLKVYGIVTNKSLLSSKEILHFDSSQIHLEKVSWYGLDDYDIKLNSFRSNSSSKNIHLNGIELIPHEDKFSFMSHQTIEKDWFDCKIGSLFIGDFDLDRFQKKRELFANQIQIDSASIEIYRDKRKKDAVKKFKALPGRTIRSIHPAMHIAQLELTNSQINYYEFEKDASEAIEVHLRDFKLEMSNITSDSSLLLENNVLKLKGESKFMNGGSLSLHSEFYLLDTNDSFTLEAELRDLAMPALNPMLNESAFIKFEDGKLNSLTMKMNGNDNNASGTLDIDYSGLKHLKLLRKRSELRKRKEHGSSGKKEKEFLSFFVEKIVPADYGPDKAHYQQGDIALTRLKHKSFINFLVNGIKDGLMSSLLHSHPHFESKMKKKASKN